MRKELEKHFQHFWRTFRRIVEDFQETSWIDKGYSLTTPARLAFHIIQSSKYYMSDKQPIVYKSGKSVDTKSKDLQREELPSKEDILYIVDSMVETTGRWLNAIDLDGENIDYPWTGDSMGSVVLFLIRHSQHHLGEMNALLNEQEAGKADDHFAKSL
jgi:uncharacterized damage-inducible protein DinB